jgi:hypothetical protein
MFVLRVLSRVFELKVGEETRDSIMLQNEELHNVVMTVKFRRIIEEAHVACMVGTRHKNVWSINQEERNHLEC